MPLTVNPFPLNTVLLLRIVTVPFMFERSVYVCPLIDTRLGLLAVPLAYIVRSPINAPPAFPWGEYFVEICYSSDVSVKYSDFLLNSTATGSYPIYAEYDSSVNVSHNMFSGATSR